MSESPQQFENVTLPDWVENGIVSQKSHKEILDYIRNKEKKGTSVPLHYRLYKHLSITGELPNEIRNHPISSQHEDAIKALIPDTAKTMFYLEKEGYRVHVINASTDTKTLKQRARQVSEIIKKTYPDPRDTEKTLYPIQEGSEHVVTEQIQENKQFCWILEDKNKNAIATSSLIKRGNEIEAGRSGASFSSLRKLKEKQLSLRGFTNLRLLHLLTNPDSFGIDSNNEYFLRLDARTTCFSRKDSTGKITTPSGKNTQGMWFGGLKKGSDIGVGIAGGSWLYTVGNKNETYGNEQITGGVEPVMRGFLALNPHLTDASFSNKAIYTPDEKTLNLIKSLLETMIDTSQVTFSVLPEYEGESSLHVQDSTHSLTKNVYAKLEEGGNTPLERAIETISAGSDIPAIQVDVPCSFDNDVNDEILEITSTQMNTYKRLGFVVSGIYLHEDGKLSITYTKLLPHCKLNGLLPVELPPKYYEGTRLESAVHTVEKIYENLENQV